MIVDLTEKFYESAATSRTALTQSNWHASHFIQTSTSYLGDLKDLEAKLNDLEKNVRMGSRFDREKLSKMMLNVKEHLKLCQKNIRKLKTSAVDIKSKKKMAQKLKESILMAMQLKMLKSSFKFKEVHLTYAKKTTQNRQSVVSNQREINLSKAQFLQNSQEEVLQQVARTEYKQIEKSIGEISQMYKETMNVVRMHELMIDNIEEHIDEADGHIQQGRGHLSQLHGREQKNRKFILKVFAILYVTVFVYLVFLS